MVLSRRFYDDGLISIKLTKKQLKTRDEVKRKERKKYYTFCDMKCDCGNTKEFEVIAEKDRYGLPVKTCICKRCGLIMTNPTYDQESLNRFYDEDYRNLYVAYDGPNKNFFDEQYNHGILIGNYIDQYRKLNESTRILEIGTGAGGILKAINEKYGSKVIGIDLGSEYIEFGKLHGLELYQESAEVHTQKGNKYDVIILSHVIEHFLDLKHELDQIKKLLVADGIVYIEVPGIRNTYKTYGTLIKSLQNAHVRYFSLNTLKQTMNCYGFSFITGDEFIRSIFKMDGTEGNGIIRNYYQEDIAFLKSHEKAYIWYTTIRPLLARMKHRIFG